MYPITTNIAVIQLFTLNGIKFALIMDILYVLYTVVVQFYVRYVLVKFRNRFMKRFILKMGCCSSQLLFSPPPSRILAILISTPAFHPSTSILWP
jgi:hypothetical protein